MISPETEPRQFAQRVSRLSVFTGVLAGVEVTLVLLVVGTSLVKVFTGTSLLAPPLGAVLMPLSYLVLGSMLLVLRHQLTLLDQRRGLGQRLPLFEPAQRMLAMAGALSIAGFMIGVLSLWLPWYLAWPVPILCLLGVLWRFSRPLGQ
jgi:hypothetical protein